MKTPAKKSDRGKGKFKFNRSRKPTLRCMLSNLISRSTGITGFRYAPYER